MSQASAKLEWIETLRYPLMVGVVMVHAFDPVRSGDQLLSLQGRSEVADAVMFYISQIWARLGVPAFFVFAGYFFLKATYGAGFAEWCNQLKRRFRTLFVPFLLWSCLLFLVYFLGQRIGVVPIARLGDLSRLDIFGVLATIFGIGRSPVVYQFWFLRDLMACVILSLPLIYLRRDVFGLFVLLAGVGWFFGIGGYWTPSIASIFFFCLGGLWVIFGARLNWRVSTWLVLSVLLVLSLFDLIYRTSPYSEYIHRVFLLVGVAALYPVGNLLNQTAWLASRLKRLGMTAFFLYAAHEPILTILKKFVFARHQWQGVFEIVLIYLTPAVVTLLVCGVAYRILSVATPGILSVSTGGRN